RLIVTRNKKENIEDMIIEKTKSYKFGDPKEPETVIGPVASKKQFDKISYYINKGIEEGAKLLLGEIPKESKGYYINPVVFTDVDNHMKISREDIFVLILFIFSYVT